MCNLNLTQNDNNEYNLVSHDTKLIWSTCKITRYWLNLYWVLNFTIQAFSLSLWYLRSEVNNGRWILGGKNVCAFSICFWGVKKKSLCLLYLFFRWGKFGFLKASLYFSLE